MAQRMKSTVAAATLKAPLLSTLAALTTTADGVQLAGTMLSAPQLASVFNILAADIQQQCTVCRLCCNFVIMHGPLNAH